MNSNPNDRKQSASSKDDEEIKPEAPSWRFAQIQSNPGTTRPSPLASARAPSEEVIDKASFFGKARSSSSREDLPPPAPPKDSSQTSWSPKTLRPVPAFYPLEKSSRFITDDLLMLTGRLSDCLRILSVQAAYNDESATASLVTAEQVEMHLSLWKTNPGSGGKYPQGIVVELQRRKGDSITFHRYSRYILDAAVGDFDPEAFVDIESGYMKKVERMLSRNQVDGGATTEEENAIIAIEIAHGLLLKDRMDARQLGLESLCLLTDPLKTSITTALITSRVVLLGTTRGQDDDDDNVELVYDEAPFQEIRETILSIVQLRRIGDETEEFVDAAAFDLSGGGGGDSDNDEFDGKPSADVEHINVLYNLALAVLANALDVIEKLDQFDDGTPEETTPAARGRLGSKDIANAFMNDAKGFSDKEILSTLISELGKASNSPHNACLSAKCLRCLMGASDDAVRKAKELGAKNVVSTALDVGVKTHAKLETECKKVVKVMSESQLDDNEQQEEEEEDNEQDE